MDARVDGMMGLTGLRTVSNIGWRQIVNILLFMAFASRLNQLGHPAKQLNQVGLISRLITDLDTQHSTVGGAHEPAPVALLALAKVLSASLPTEMLKMVDHLINYDPNTHRA